MFAPSTFLYGHISCVVGGKFSPPCVGGHSIHEIINLGRYFSTNNTLKEPKFVLGFFDLGPDIRRLRAFDPYVDIIFVKLGQVRLVVTLRRLGRVEG